MTIGSGVVSIGYEAFRNCTGLTSMTFRGLVAPSVGADWILYTSAGIRGHALAESDFPAPGDSYNGLTMGTPYALTAPDVPSNLSAVPGNGEVVPTWEETSAGGSDITNYNVYRSATENGTSSLIASPTDLGYTDAGLTNGLTYWYNVSAVNSQGEGERTAPLSSTPYTVPDAPTIVSAVPSLWEIVVTWSANGNGGSPITSYNLYRCDSEGGAYTLIASLAELTYTDTGLTGPHMYWYKVSAMNAAGESAMSPVVTTVVPMAGDVIDDSMLIFAAAAILIGAVAVAVFVLIRRSIR